MVFPYKWFKFPFAISGDAVTSPPDPVQAGGNVSYTQGYGPDYSLDPATNPSAIDIERADMNGLFNDITTAIQYWETGKAPTWIDATTNGGSSFSYPLGAVVLYTDGVTYLSVAATNTTTPGTNRLKWIPINYGRIALTANTTFNVATTGNDTTGDGVNNAWLTLQHAANVLQSSYDLAGYQATIQMADGTYAADATFNSQIPGQVSPVIINGNAGTPTNVLIGGAIAAQRGGWIQPQNFASGGGAANSFVAGSDGRIDTGVGLFLETVVGAHFYTNGGTINVLQNYTINGAVAAAHFQLFNGGVISVSASLSNTISLSPTITVFANNVGGGQLALVLPNATWTGAMTAGCQRYQAQFCGCINVSGGGASVFPGSVAGATSLGGQYQ